MAESKTGDITGCNRFKVSKDVKNANHWWDEECKRAIKEKNEARKKCLIRKQEQIWIFINKKE